MRFVLRIAVVLASIAVLPSPGAEAPADSPPQATEPGTQTNAIPTAALSLRRDPPGNRESRIGDSFTKGIFEAGVSLGTGVGKPSFGSTTSHDLVLMKLSVGKMMTDVLAKGRFYQGNVELLGEIFAGGQYHPRDRYLIGLTGVVRYNFVTGTRWVPFVDFGTGVTATDIGGPDLSTTFQFNTQGGPGVRWFVNSHTSVTAQYRFIHISNAGIDRPNLGVNTSVFYAGISWVF